MDEFKVGQRVRVIGVWNHSRSDTLHGHIGTIEEEDGNYIRVRFPSVIEGWDLDYADMYLSQVELHRDVTASEIASALKSLRKTFRMVQ